MPHRRVRGTGAKDQEWLRMSFGMGERVAINRKAVEGNRSPRCGELGEVAAVPHKRYGVR
jgi:hypothetical protein